MKERTAFAIFLVLSLGLIGYGIIETHKPTPETPDVAVYLDNKLLTWVPSPLIIRTDSGYVYSHKTFDSLLLAGNMFVLAVRVSERPPVYAFAFDSPRNINEP